MELEEKVSEEPRAIDPQKSVVHELVADVSLPPHRSSKISQPLKRYMDMLMKEVKKIFFMRYKDHSDDLNTFDEVMSNIEFKKLLDTIKSEIDSMHLNQVWTLVDPPEGIVPIGCKWIFKRKIGSDGNVETFKARLIAKDYHQCEGIDYQDTFSPVAMLKSILTLLAVAAYFDYEI